MVKIVIAALALLLAGCVANPQRPDPDWLNKAFTEHAKNACLQQHLAQDCQ